jgi:uncharacterized protein YcbK (DUF882 family)
VGTASAAAPARFFIMGSGSLAITNAHTGEKTSVRYRREDGTYDPAALGLINRAFRSRGDGGETEMSLRLIEILSHLQRIAGDRPLVLLSGYRSPSYNQGLKDKGRAVAGGSLHTEGLAADLAFPRGQLPTLWQQVRALECCGAGYYARQGFLHVDVGRPRFWEEGTSRVEENLSAGNARLFARTEFDRYAVGEAISVRLHALTVGPIGVAHEILAVELGTAFTLADGERCVLVDRDGASLRLHGEARRASGVLEVRTCDPRPGQTPEAIQTNRIEIF